MKKRTFIVVILFCISSFFTVLEYRNTQLSNRWHVKLGGDEAVLILNATDDYTSEETVDILLGLAKDFGITLLKSDGNYYEGKYTDYIFTSDINLSNTIPIINKKDINFEKYNSLEFYSSLKDSNSLGTIFSYYPNTFIDFTVSNFYPIINESRLIYGWMTVGGAPDNLSQFIEHAQSIFGDTLVVSEMEGVVEDSKKIDFTPFVITFILLVVSLLQVLNLFIKEISIRRTLGQKNHKIIKSVFSKNLMFLSLIVLMAYSFLYIIIVSNFNVYTFVLITDLLKLSLAFIALLILSVIFVFIFLKSIPPVSFIKNRSFNERLYGMNYVIKVLLLLLIMPSITNVSLSIKSDFEWKQYLDEYSKISKRSTKLLSYSFEDIDVISDVLAEALDEFSNLENSFAYYSNSFDYKNSSKPYYLISEGYLKYLGINFDKLSKDKPTLIIPKGYREQDVLDLCFNCNYVTLQKDYDFYIFGLDRESEHKNIVLVSYPNNEMLEKEYDRAEYVNISSTEREAETLAASLNNQYGRFLTFGSQKMQFYSFQRSVNTKLIISGVMFMELSIILVFIVYNAMVSFYELSKKEMALYLSLGKSRLHRMIKLLSQDVLTLILLIYYMITKNLDFTSLLVLIVVVDVMLAYCIIRKNEKKSLVESIRG